MPKKPTSLKEQVGARLSRTREALGMKPSEFAKYLGDSQQKLRNWEKGDHFPDPERMVELCNKTRFTMDWLYRGLANTLPQELYEKVTRPKVVPPPQSTPARRKIA